MLQYYFRPCKRIRCQYYSQAVLAANEMVEAEVVRSVRTMEEQTIMAVRFRGAAAGGEAVMRKAA